MKLIVTLFAALALAASAHGDALAAPASDSKAGSTQAKTKAAKARAATKAKSANATSSKARSKAAKAAPMAAAGAAVASVVDTDNEHVNFLEWQPVREFIDGMVAQHGFERTALETLFGQVRFIDTAVQLVKPAPPGKPKNWQAYSARFIEPIRIRAGVRFWEQNAEALKRAEAAYGVPAEIIVGIIGIETIYGRDTGRFRVLDALTTLAFAYPDSPKQAARQAFFRDELSSTLILARERGYDPFSLLGSFAGAVGMPQFMPSNILKYGVDFDNDGRVDLRDSSVDAIGSVANFLVQHGWNAEHRGPVAYAADVSPTRAWEPLLELGLEATLRPEALRAAGVVTGTALPAETRYGLIDLQNGAEPTEYWVGNDNFYAITKYNRSYFYAMSVVDLGRAVRAARPE
jgi:membrane-bound lytic murein transglycosylase B